MEQDDNLEPEEMTGQPTRATGDQSLPIENLVGADPKELLQYGPSKLYVDSYNWHLPEKGIIASYTVTEENVTDHFGIFRGVDQIEAFAQASIVSCAGFLECAKLKCSLTELRERFLPAFISLGNVYFHHYLQPGDTFISIAGIKFYKFRQMACDGRIYKVPEGLDITRYFQQFTPEKLFSYELDPAFKLVAELFQVTGRALKKEIFTQTP